ncbi:MAG: hypothetical protein KC416_09800, partial [Myxococcales bacterium]|nr:hypothetical protein [Myxococcales bacterium]
MIILAPYLRARPSASPAAISNGFAYVNVTRRVSVTCPNPSSSARPPLRMRPSVCLAAISAGFAYVN